MIFDVIFDIFAKAGGGSAVCDVQDNSIDVVLNNNVTTAVSKAIVLMTMLPDSASTYRLTFSEYTSRDFKDWVGLTASDISANTNNAVGFPIIPIAAGSYDSAVEILPQTLGEPSLQKQSTYIHTYYDYIRDGFNTLETPDEFDT